jgi:hypothetical protein
MVLGLEHAGPFWADMGLAVPVSTALREMAFRGWKQLQARLDAPSLSVERYEADWQSAVALALQQMEERLGVGTRQLVEDWVEHRFPWEDNQEAQQIVWSSVWRKAHEEDLSTLQLPDEKRGRVWQEIGEFLRWKEQFGRHFDATVPRHGTGTDLEILATYTEDCSPYDWVAAAVSYHHFSQTWAKLEQLLDDAQLDELTRWQRTVADQYRVNSKLVHRPRFVPVTPLGTIQ